MRIRTVIVTVVFFLAGVFIGYRVYESLHPDITSTVHPRKMGGVLNNPFIGMAPPAGHGPYQHPHRLVYLVLPWNELEPEKGKYAFDEIERNYKFDEWHQQGVSVIIRFVMDFSTSEHHKDIPDWLYEEIGKDGIWYNEAALGKGFSPNYDNPTLIRLHQQTIEALGNRYDKDPRIAFIALGSLGHWGEWHTYSNDKINIPFPKLAVSDQYVRHYLQYFPNKRLLMRRPHLIAKENGIGLYNDLFGVPVSTSYYVDWFENGYYSLLAGGTDIPAMPDFWKKGPSGGEFGNGGRVLEYFQTDAIDQVLQMVERSHVSWLGPNNPADLPLNPAEQANLDRLLIRMGYRFHVATASYPETAIEGRNLTVTLTIGNEGVAPIYYDWPVEISISDEKGWPVMQQTETGLIRGWLPGKTSFDVSMQVPEGLAEGTYKIDLAVLDPDTMKPGIEFAMEGKRPDGSYGLGQIRIRKPNPVERFQAWLGGL